MQPSAHSSFQKLNVDDNCQKTRNIRYYVFQSYCISLSFPKYFVQDCRYLLYPPLPQASAFEVCLAGLMLIVAAPVDLVLGLTLIVATLGTPISISLKCWWFSPLKP